MRFVALYLHVLYRLPEIDPGICVLSVHLIHAVAVKGQPAGAIHRASGHKSLDPQGWAGSRKRTKLNISADQLHAAVRCDMNSQPAPITVFCITIT